MGKVICVKIGGPSEEEEVIRKKLELAHTNCTNVLPGWLLTKIVGRSSTGAQKMDIVIAFLFGRDSANYTRMQPHKKTNMPCFPRWPKQSPLEREAEGQNVCITRTWSAPKMQGTGEFELTRTTKMQATGSASNTVKIKFAPTG